MRVIHTQAYKWVDCSRIYEVSAQEALDKLPFLSDQGAAAEICERIDLSKAMSLQCMCCTRHVPVATCTLSLYNTFRHLGGIYALTPYPFVWSADGSGWTPWQIACKAQRSHSGKEGVYFIAFEPSGSASQIPVVVAVRVAVSCTHRLRLLLLQRGTVALSSILHRRVPTQVAHLPSLHGGKTSESCTQRLMQVTKPSTEPASELAGYRVGQLLGIRMPKLRLLNCWTDPEGLLFVKTLHRPAAHGHAALRS